LWRRIHRPFAGGRAYRTPIGSLYLWGASSDPGGNVTGLPGNAAQIVLRDLGLEAERMPPPIATRLAAF